MSSESTPGGQAVPVATAEPAMPEQKPITATRDEASANAPHAASELPSVRVEGLAETLHEVRHELGMLSKAHRYNWLNQRLILLRNFIIAMSVIIGVAVVVTMCYREAYRQTLTISAFDVPEKLAERGITGQVVAKALFDELIKRRKTVTTLDAGDLKGAWTENRSDVAVPETKLTFQSVFRYLRHITGNEIAVDGEMLIDGDNVTIKARVAGNPPRAVKGKLADWESLLGELANYVYETTQPAVLASYLGLTARTPEDLAYLSVHIRKMLGSNPRPSDEVMAVAYEAYGSALIRQNKETEALVAFDQAISFDPQFGLAVLNAARASHRVSNYKRSADLYQRVFKMNLSDSVRVLALRERVASFYNQNDCPGWDEATRAAKTFPLYNYNYRLNDSMEAIYLVRCDFQQAKGIRTLEDFVLLHPDASGGWNLLGNAYRYRPNPKYSQSAVDAYRRAIATDTTHAYYFPHFNMAVVLAAMGEHEQALAAYQGGKKLLKMDTPYSQVGLANIYFHNGEYRAAEQLMRRTTAEPSAVTPRHFDVLARAIDHLGRPDEALATFRAGQKLFPADCSLYNEAGLVLLKQQRPQEAFAEFDRGIAAVKKCGLPYISYARALIELKRIPEARAKLDALIKIAPTSDGAEEAKEILAGLAKAG